MHYVQIMVEIWTFACLGMRFALAYDIEDAYLCLEPAPFGFEDYNFFIRGGIFELQI